MAKVAYIVALAGSMALILFAALELIQAGVQPQARSMSSQAYGLFRVLIGLVAAAGSKKVTSPAWIALYFLLGIIAGGFGGGLGGILLILAGAFGFLARFPLKKGSWQLRS